MFRRITILAAAISILTLACPVTAQLAEKVYLIGILSPQDANKIEPWDQAFRASLQTLGWVEGKNIAFVYRHAEGRTDRLPALAAELVRLDPIIVVALNGNSARAVQRWNSSVPIVMPYSADAVRQGIVGSLTRPDGNITGLSELIPEASGKRLQLLKETVPEIERIAVLWTPRNSASRLTWKDTQLSARRLGLTIYSLPVRSADEFERAFADAAKAGSGAIAITPGALFGANLRTLAALALRYRLPSIWVRKEFAAVGGMFSYGPDRRDMFRRAAAYVDKILKGAKPADLPIEQATRFYLHVNLKTANALGVKIPRSILLRADEVIE